MRYFEIDYKIFVNSIGLFKRRGRSWSHISSRVRFAGLVGLISSTAVTHAATLTVGPGQRYDRIAAAIAASQDGDTINVMAGLYVNDFAEIRTKITLNAIGGMARIQAKGFIPNEKGILITDTDVTINGFELFGARVTVDDGANGAGIRYQGGNLTLNDCYIHDNQDGILADTDPTATIAINNSEFYHNGDKSGPDAGYTHNLYVGGVALLDIENSYFHGAYVGHEIKSRAQQTIVRDTRVVDGPNGTASYSIDLPNGGLATIENDEIEQGPRTQNPIIIAYGEEGGVYANSSLLIQNSLIENDLGAGDALAVWNASGVTATISGNSVFGLNSSQILNGSANIAGMTFMTTEPAIPTKHPWQ
jgi:hypothetical protein